MKVDHVETPFLYLEADGEGDSTSINSKYLPSVVPYVAPPTGAPGAYEMPVEELRVALGLLDTDENGLVNLPRPRWVPDEFGVQRQEMYSGEAQIATLSEGLPGTPGHRAASALAARTSHTLLWRRPLVLAQKGGKSSCRAPSRGSPSIATPSRSSRNGSGRRELPRQHDGLQGPDVAVRWGGIVNRQLPPTHRLGVHSGIAARKGANIPWGRRTARALRCVVV